MSSRKRSSRVWQSVDAASTPALALARPRHCRNFSNQGGHSLAQSAELQRTFHLGIGLYPALSRFRYFLSRSLLGVASTQKASAAGGSETGGSEPLRRQRESETRIVVSSIIHGSDYACGSFSATLAVAFSKLIELKIPRIFRSFPLRGPYVPSLE